MELRRLVELSSRVRATSKKSEKITLIADFLRRTHGKDTELAALYLTGALPQGRIGVGWRAIEEVGEEAGEEAGGGETGGRSPLSLEEVDTAFSRIASDQGPGSSDRKIGMLQALFRWADPEERRFLGHLLIGEVRQGALEGIVLEAIAKAASLPAPEVLRAMMFSGSIGEVARVALEEGSVGLSRFSVRLFSAVAPMLANSADDVTETLERLGEAAFEFKLDGGRIQVHKGGEEVRIFTRQLQEITDRLPEVVEAARALPIREAILEGEASRSVPMEGPSRFRSPCGASAGRKRWRRSEVRLPSPLSSSTSSTSTGERFWSVPTGSVLSC